MTHDGSEVDPSEPVARFLFSLRRDVRPQDGSIRPERLYPYKYVELSVSVLGSRTPEEIWRAGDAVGSELPEPKPCIGRADLLAQAFYAQALKVVRVESPSDPGHADVTGWPPEKEAQKQIALDIIAKGKPVFVERKLATPTPASE